MLIKRMIYQEDITFVKIYALSVGAPNFLKQTLLDIKGQIGPQTVVGDFNITLSSIDHTDKKNP
jgi:hypothetical protein